VTADVLHELTRVMSRIPADDFQVVDLYRNQGNADPLIVATALELRRCEEEKFFGDEWVIVSSDEAVVGLAREYGIAALRTEGLVELIESSLAS